VVRLARHLLTPDWWARRPFPASVLDAIGRAIAASERLHRGEIAFAIEGGLPLPFLRLGCRQRAEQVFGALGVWDTEENSGVLVYVQLVDRDIEIVADRGIARRVEHARWEEVCRRMQDAFRAGRYLEGSLEGIERVTSLLARHFPAQGVNPNELPDRPRLI
jgi:hypothetical protein